MLNTNRTVTYGQAIDLAIGLQSEGGENPEYDRALVELVADLFAVEGSMEYNQKIVRTDMRQREIVLRSR